MTDDARSVLKTAYIPASLQALHRGFMLEREVTLMQIHNSMDYEPSINSKAAMPCIGSGSLCGQ